MSAPPARRYGSCNANAAWSRLTTNVATASTRQAERVEADAVPPVLRGVRPLVKQLGLRGVTPHTLRHTYASLLLADGKPLHLVQELLGHSNPGFTLAVYGHLIPGIGAERWTSWTAWANQLRRWRGLNQFDYRCSRTSHSSRYLSWVGCLSKGGPCRTLEPPAFLGIGDTCTGIFCRHWRAQRDHQTLSEALLPGAIPGNG
jgi:hypothetical protein